MPYLIVISTDDLICQEVNDILAEFGGHVFFSYDTTFNIGDFLVSPLLCRHPYLENDIAFPVAFLFHDSKEEIVHDIFFRWIVKTFPLKKSKGLCGTDGEKSIINSLNGIENLRCWNHLLQNIEYWTKRHTCQKHDWVYYKSQVKSIIQQEN